MSEPATTRFAADYGKRAAGCKKCKMQLEKGSLRMAKIVPNFFVQRDDGRPPPDMKQYFHVNCLFEMLFKARVTTKVIEDNDEIEGFDELKSEDQEEIGKLVAELVEKRTKDGGATPKTPKTATKRKKPETESVSENDYPVDSALQPEETPKGKGKEKKKKEEAPAERKVDENAKFNLFYKFCKLCSALQEEATNEGKADIFKAFIYHEGFNGDIAALVKLLHPNESTKKYKNIDEVSILNIFSEILEKPVDELNEAFGKSNDVSEVIKNAVADVKTNPKSDWSIHKTERWLERLATLDDAEKQAGHWKFATKRVSPLEIQYLVRMAFNDLKTGFAGRDMLRAIHEKAYEVYKEEGLLKVAEKFDNKNFEEKKKKVAPLKKGPAPKRSRKEETDEEEEPSESENSESESEGVDSDADDDDDDDKENYNSSASESVESSSSSEDEDDDGYAVEKCPKGRTACKYGKDCFRKNRDHLKQYWHPRRV